MCEDRATTYLKRLGYAVVRQTMEGIEAAALIAGLDATQVLGSLCDVITNRSWGASDFHARR